MADGKTKVPYFVREATGLVRQISAVDVFIFNIFNIGLNLVLFLAFSWVNYPGASIELAILLTMGGSISMSVVYIIYARIFARTGAEYVFLSRTVTPVFGMIISWNAVIWNLWYIGANSASVVFSGLAPFFSTLSLLTGNSTLASAGSWFGSSTGILVAGSIIVLFFGALLTLGMRNYFTFQKAAFVLTIVGFSVGAIVMAISTQHEFISRFNTLLGPISSNPDTYHEIISTASSKGLTLSPSFSIFATLNLTLWAWTGLAYGTWSTAFSGEVKNAKSSQALGIPLSIVFAGLIYIIWTSLGEQTFGSDFLRSAAYLSSYYPQLSPFPGTPFLSNLIAILSNNTYVASVVLLGVVAASLMIPAMNFIYCSRGMFAWSIDRVLPDRLCQVSTRVHTPVYILAILTFFGIVFVALYAFAGSAAVLVNLYTWGIFGESLTFLGTTIAAIFLPFYKNDFYRGSPGDIRVGKIPAITLAGLISTAFIGFIFYRFFVDPFIGTNTPLALEIVFGVFLSGAVIYYLLKGIRKKQGIDITLAFKQIPIE